MFVVLGDEQNEDALLDAASSAFFTVLVLPHLADCMLHAYRYNDESEQSSGRNQRNLENTADSINRSTSSPGISQPSLRERFDTVYTFRHWSPNSYARVAKDAVTNYAVARVLIRASFLRPEHLRKRFTLLLCTTFFASASSGATSA